MSGGLTGISSTTSLQLNSGFDRVLAEKFEASVARFERVGIQLFGVANCFVTFGKVAGRSGGGEHSITEMEAAFCDDQPLGEDFVIATDLSEHPDLREHRFVTADPFIRFYASYPVYGNDQSLVACIRLIDYQPHTLNDVQNVLLADLAAMVERELALSALYQNQVELVKQNRYLKRESLIDPLLGTWNKAAIVRSLRIEQERCVKAEKPVSLLFLLPDQMAEMREKYGIAATDQVLIRMVSRVRSCIRPFDALGRFGEDRLLVVLPGASHLVAKAVAERIRLSVYTHTEWLEREQQVTVSIGAISTDTYPETDPEELISLAEKALLSARSAGSNSVMQATPNQPDITI